MASVVNVKLPQAKTIRCGIDVYLEVKFRSRWRAMLRKILDIYIYLRQFGGKNKRHDMLEDKIIESIKVFTYCFLK